MKKAAQIFTFVFLLSILKLFTGVQPLYAACSLGDLSSAKIDYSITYDKGIPLPNTISVEGAPESFRNKTLWVFLISLEESGEPGSTTGGPLGSFSINSAGSGQLQFNFADLNDNTQNIRNGSAVILFSDYSLLSDDTVCPPQLSTTIVGAPTCLGLGQACIPDDPNPPTFCNASAICNPQTNQVALPLLSHFEGRYINGMCYECEVSADGVTLGCAVTTEPVWLDTCRIQRGEGPPITCGPNDTGINTALGCISVANIGDSVGNLLFIAAGLGGGMALLLMGYGTFLITTSAGIPDKINEGKNIITAAVAGLLFIVMSVVLFQLIGVEILQLPGLQ